MDEQHSATYNFDSFTQENFQPWMRFDASPALGERGPTFPLWDLAGEPTSLAEIVRLHTYTIVEFGSFT